MQSKLALEWRAWLTERLLQQYLSSRTFYTLQSQSQVDDPTVCTTSAALPLLPHCIVCTAIRTRKVRVRV
jgi:hypothetical protein